MNIKTYRIAVSTVLCLLFAVIFNITTASEQTKSSRHMKVAFVTFLSGAAAVPFGIPARNAAQVIVEAINAGSVPEPYSSPGLAGVKVEAVFIDENSKNKIEDYRNLVRKKDIDLVIGYISSSSCKAIAPVAEQEKTLTVLFDCGTPEIFEDIVLKPDYVFRTASHATMDNVAAAKYVLQTNKNVSSIAGINQNYAWGQGSWRDFSASMKILNDSVSVSIEQFPKLFSGQYGEEISTLLTHKPAVVHSSFWGSDVEALVIQGGIQGVFSTSQLVLTAGDTAIHRLGPQIPDGTIIGARGSNGQLAPRSELNDWFRTIYFQRFGSFPTYPAYHMAQAILGVKAASDKKGSSNPNALRAGLTGLQFASPNGRVSMSLSDGHQAVTNTAYGSYHYDKKTGKGKLINIKRYQAACVNPPIGVKSIDWIKSGFKGAECL